MPDVTSTDLNLYEPAAAMDFRQRRQQMDRQETLQFVALLARPTSRPYKLRAP